MHSVAKTLRRFEVPLTKPGFLVDENIIAALSPVTHLSFPTGHPLSQSVVSNIGSGVMLPNLEYLEFGLLEEDDVQGIIDMLLARSPRTQALSRPISNLREVVIHCYDPACSWEAQVKPQLQDLRSQGMEITSLFS